MHPIILIDKCNILACGHIYPRITGCGDTRIFLIYYDNTFIRDFIIVQYIYAVICTSIINTDDFLIIICIAKYRIEATR